MSSADTNPSFVIQRSKRRRIPRLQHSRFNFYRRRLTLRLIHMPWYLLHMPWGPTYMPYMIDVTYKTAISEVFHWIGISMATFPKQHKRSGKNMAYMLLLFELLQLLHHNMSRNFEDCIQHVPFYTTVQSVPAATHHNEKSNRYQQQRLCCVHSEVLATCRRRNTWAIDPLYGGEDKQVAKSSWWHIFLS